MRWDLNSEQYAIAKGEAVCRLCKGKRKVRSSVEVPWTKSLQPIECTCSCDLVHAFWKAFTEGIPEHDQFAVLEDLKPHERSLLTDESQKKVLGILREKPRSSYAFFGPAGVGKSTFCAALYRRALFEFFNSRKEEDKYLPAVWHVSAKQLFEDFHREAISREDGNGNTIEPVINRRKIEKAAKRGYRPSVFIAEVDKLNYTKFKADAFFEIVNALYEHKGQLVFDTNLTEGEFYAMFDSEHSSTIMRRVNEMGMTIDLFSEEYKTSSPSITSGGAPTKVEQQ